MGKSFFNKLGQKMENANFHFIGDKLKNVGEEMFLGGKSLEVGGVAMEAASGGISTPVSASMVFAGEVTAGVGAEIEFFGDATNLVSDSTNFVGGLIEEITEPDKKLPKEFKTHACIAGGAYNDSKNCDGLEYQENDSKNKMDVYSDNDDPNKLWVGIEGTHPGFTRGFVRDGLADFHVFGDTLENSAMYHKIKRNITNLQEKYPDKELHLSSHSLSGSIVQKLSCDMEFASATTFNAGSTPWTRECVDPKTKVKNFTTGYDPISVSNFISRKGQETIVVKTKKGISDPLYHSMKFF